MKFLLSLAFCGDLLPRSSVTCLIALQVSGCIPRLGQISRCGVLEFLLQFSCGFGEYVKRFLFWVMRMWNWRMERNGPLRWGISKGTSRGLAEEFIACVILCSRSNILLRNIVVDSFAWWCLFRVSGSGEWSYWLLHFGAWEDILCTEKGLETPSMQSKSLSISELSIVDSFAWWCLFRVSGSGEWSYWLLHYGAWEDILCTAKGLETPNMQSKSLSISELSIC